MSDVRVRIAPSPTGDLHVGTAYIALFNYCFAKTQGGKFILRVEDTDQTRSRREYEDRIYEGLRWLGLEYDEGPDVGGPFGPYRQSERSDIYRKHAYKLVDAGKAYPCFCTPEQLNEMRKEQRANKEPEGYRGQLRPSLEEERRRVEAGETHVVRVEMPRDGVCTINDGLHNEPIEYPYAQLDDQILLKSDGMPTYHLANVVDDHLMEITHVIRGEDWLPSTPKHIYLYECFGWQAPEWMHIPLLLNPDKSKMSKRKNPTSIFYYRDAGYLPEALLNYMALIGYKRPIRTANGLSRLQGKRPPTKEADELFSLDDLMADFDIHNISLGGSIFDLQKLMWLNGRTIREVLSEEELLARMKAWRLNDEVLSQALSMMRSRLETLGDFMEKAKFFWQREVALDAESLVPKTREAPEVASALQCILWAMEESEDWTPGGVEAAVRDVAEFFEWKPRDVTGAMFPAVMGAKVGPPLFDSIALLGKDMTRARLMAAINELGAPGKKSLGKLEKRFKGR